jgi:hypothetical protein
MSKSQFIKLSGWAFIAGSFAFISMLGGSFGGSFISSILLAVGMLGLRAGYGESVGSFGKNILLISVVGMVLTYLGIFIGQQIETSSNLDFSSWWILLFAGPAVLLLALTLYGLTALRSKPMSRLNWLPVFAGLWYPVIYFSIIGYMFTNNGALPEQIPVTAIQMMISIQFIALCVFGAFLVTDTPQEMATA